MAPSTSHRLLARLHRDLKELLDDPYPGVDVFIDDADIRKFCLVLTPPSGPWTGLALHFDVKLPEDWPASPPSVESSVWGIDHPNLFGWYICCDLLKSHGEYSSDGGYTGGYTPALTLRGLFLQFLTFFSATKIEQEGTGHLVDIGDHKEIGYVQERYVAASWVIHPPWKKCWRRTGACTCWPLQPSQKEMAALWDADGSPQVTIKEINSPGVTHLVKGTQVSSPERIHRYECLNPRWISTRTLISKWTCSKCPYGTSKLPHVRPRSTRPQSMQPMPHSPGDLACPPRECQLDHLNDDVLLELAQNMSAESVITFGKAYPRFHLLASACHVLLQRELRCFFLKTPLRDGILGIGITFDAGPRILSSDFDWLSLEAFDVHNIRRSIEKREFEFFLPLAFSRPHFERAKTEIWKRMRWIDSAVRRAEDAVNSRRKNYHKGGPSAKRCSDVPPPKPQDAVKVIFKMMNNIVVALMKSCDHALRPKGDTSAPPTGLLMASEKAIISYTHLMHLLICLCRTWPVIRRDATARLQAFVQSPANCGKDVEPDLGELAVVMTLVLILTPPDTPSSSSSPSWSSLNGPFLEEALTRNARWVLKDSPELEVMEHGASQYRLSTTFKNSATGLRLLMFQIAFLDLFTRTYHEMGIKALDDNYGFPERELPERMVGEIKAIYKVDTWLAFFAKVRYAKASAFTMAGFTGMLRGAVEKSRRKGYHQSASRHKMQSLVQLRKSVDPSVVLGMR